MTIPLPSVYVIEPTTHCNISCIMCPHNRLKRHGDICIPSVEIIAKQIRGSAKFIQLYFLGEPTLHRDLIRIIKILKKNTSARVEISTNLNAVNTYSEWESILLSGVDRMLCCIEGTTVRSHKFLRPTGDFKQAVKAAETLALIKKRNNLSIELIIKCIGTIHNASEKDDFFSIWGEIDGLTPSWSWMNTWASTMPALVNISTELAPNINVMRKACAEIWNKMVIRWDGDVVLCCHDWNSSTVIGNIMDNDLHHIWNDTIMSQYRKNHLNNIYHGICNNCVEWSITQEYKNDYNLKSSEINLPDN